MSGLHLERSGVESDTRLPRLDLDRPGSPGYPGATSAPRGTMLAGLLVALTTAAMAMDHSEWQAVLDRYRTPAAQVDYAGIQATDALRGYREALAKAPEPVDRADKLAFWLNAYNASTIGLVAESWPISSIRDLDGAKVWTTRRFQVAGQPLTLDQMEKDKLGPLNEPRIHFALNCASQGCPPLLSEAFTASTVNAQLSAATRAWVPTTGAVVDRAANKVVLSSIFDWYAHDFPDPGGSAIPGADPRLQGALKFAAENLPEAAASWILKGNYEVGFSPYSWAVNAK